MKMTPKQINVTADWLRRDVRGREHQPEALYIQVALDALDSYQRVEAWANGGALDAVINHPGLSHELRDAVRACRDEVRRALYGEE